MLNTDLRAAVQQDKPDLVKSLLAQGADPNAVGPWHASGGSWKTQIGAFFGRGKDSNSASALGVALGMNVSGDFNPVEAHWNEEVISALLSHGALLNPTAPHDRWGSLKGWTLDNNGYGMAYFQRFNLPPGSRTNPVGVGHIYFQKHKGAAIIAAFRRAGMKRS